ncbi:winged helix-turn-helix domain-containing protein [Verrucosispora sp. TAA-831]|uniref:winged helix-turn-helix domain-containing protein n=1 Tax=Verrucosispora sp. TAA-831 TaxID=3422227 RepID=UPI003D6FC04C
MVFPQQPAVGYVEVADLLRERIASGQLRPGARLPSERDLAQTFGVALKTARAALGLLRQEGLATAIRGYGIVVREQVEPERIVLSPGDELTARQPTPAERDRYAMPEGVPLLVVIHPEGPPSEYPAHRFRLAVPAA